MVYDTGHLDATRWAIYFALGTPFIAWLVFTRDNALRVTGAISMLIFVANTFTSRRYLWVVGVGPSNIAAYAAIVGLFLARHRLPPLGGVGVAWSALLFFGLTGLVIGSLGTRHFIWNAIAYQQLYIEQLAFFLLGAMAFTRNDELRRFLLLWVTIGLVVASAHYFTEITGFRFRDYSAMTDSAEGLAYGGFFGNPNTMGSFYCMCLPIALLLVTAGRLEPWTRAFVGVSFLAMLGSLLIAVHRGGILTSSILMLAVVLTSMRRPSRGAVVLVVGGSLVALTLLGLSTLLPSLVDVAEYRAEGKGLTSSRLAFWPIMLRIVLEHPFGIGLATQNLEETVRQYGTNWASTHNLYLAVPAQVGIPGLIAFLAVVWLVLRRAFAALRVSDDQDQRVLVMSLILAVAGFLIVGVTESVWENGYKVNNLFGLMTGISFGTSQRILASLRRAREDEPVRSELEGAAAPSV